MSHRQAAAPLIDLTEEEDADAAASVHHPAPISNLAEDEADAAPLIDLAEEEEAAPAAVDHSVADVDGEVAGPPPPAAVVPSRESASMLF
jgi:hypothetical protein